MADKLKGTYDREADKFDEIPAGTGFDLGQHPERSRGSRSVVAVIPAGYQVAADGSIILADDAHVDTLITEDSVTADRFYVGKAVIGTASSAALWQIKRISVTDIGGITDVDIGWADSNDAFDNIFDNRESLSYSK